GDEPVSALDVSVQAQVLNLLKELQRELGLANLFVTHNLPVVRFIADIIAVIYLGQFVEMAPRRALLEKPRHPYTYALLSAAPVVKAQRRRRPIILAGEVPSAADPPSGCRVSTPCPLGQAIRPPATPTPRPSGP